MVRFLVGKSWCLLEIFLPRRVPSEIWSVEALTNFKRLLGIVQGWRDDICHVSPIENGLCKSLSNIVKSNIWKWIMFYGNRVKYEGNAFGNTCKTSIDHCRKIVFILVWKSRKLEVSEKFWRHWLESWDRQQQVSFLILINTSILLCSHSPVANDATKIFDISHFPLHINRQ